MAGSPKPEEPAPPNAGVGWSVLSYLIAGMLVWGFVGWLIDRWLHLGGVAIAIGVVVGMAGGVYLVVRRIGK